MTWTVNINGHDSYGPGVKGAYEDEIVARAKAFVKELAGLGNGDGEGVVTSAIAVTNTTGSVDLLK